MVSCQERLRRKRLSVSFVVARMGVDICFGSAFFSPILHVRELPDFASLLARGRSNRPRCVIWHGWLPGLGVAGERDPWPASLGQLAVRSLEQQLVAYPADGAGLGVPPDFWDAEDLAIEIGEHPCVWTDGSREDYATGGFEVAGAGVYLLAPELALEGTVWSTVEEYGDARLDRCRAFMPVLGPLWTVQRAEFCGGHFGSASLLAWAPRY